jgi:DNA-binding response OmpR family regulator
VKTVLVVDDEPSICDLVRTVLENQDCRVLEAGNGEVGLDLAARQRPDLVLVDCRMPGLSGAQVLKQLRADARTAAIPVILMSGLRDEETERAGRCLHAEGYLLKPFRPVQLLGEVQQALRATARAAHNGVAA